MEIESRLLPCGLHVVGEPPSAAEAIATLVNIAEIDRVDNDPPIAGLPGTLARCIGRNVEEIYLNNNKVRVPSPPSKQCMLQAVRDSCWRTLFSSRCRELALFSE